MYALEIRSNDEPKGVQRIRVVGKLKWILRHFIELYNYKYVGLIETNTI